MGGRGDALWGIVGRLARTGERSCAGLLTFRTPVPSLRAALWLWYRGTHFRGWQRQSQTPTLQQTVEEALRARGITSGLAAAGRTDRGVHARQQIASLRVPRGTDLGALATLHGADWGCAAAAVAPDGFHAQWTPSTKEYRYRLSVASAPPPAWASYAWDIPSDDRLQGAPVVQERLLACLFQARGTRDFFAFHAASSARRPRTLSHVEAHLGEDGLLEVRLRGSGFGRYQVRALLGGAALVAGGHLTEKAWTAALEDASRFAGILAPAQGLTLWAQDYGGKGPFEDEASARLPVGPPFDAVG